MFPATASRVPENTAPTVNEHIQRRLEENVSRVWVAGPEAIERRLVELDREWDIERLLEANASLVMLLGVGLGAFVSLWWFVLPALVAGFLLQHALQGWCPPLPVFRWFGVRTQTEIDQERYALKALRGDFRNVVSEPNAPNAMNTPQILAAVAK